MTFRDVDSAVDRIGQRTTVDPPSVQLQVAADLPPVGSLGITPQGLAAPGVPPVGLSAPIVGLAVPGTVEESRPELAPVSELLRRERVYRWLLACVDAIAASATTYAATLIWGVRLEWTFALVPGYAVLIGKIQGLYDRDERVVRKSTLAEWRRLLQAAVLISVGVYITWRTVTNSSQFRHPTLFGFIGVGVFALATAGRVLARKLARRIAKPERCLIVGDFVESQDLARRLGEIPGVELAGALPSTRESWSVDSVAEVAERMNVHRFVVSTGRSSAEQGLLELIRSAKWLGLRVSLLPGVMTVIGAATTADPLDGTVLLGVPRFGLSRSSLAVKRALDLTFAIVWLVVLAPLWVVVAIAIRLESDGPALFRQTRVGRDGCRFQILKFRSMVQGAEAMQAALEPMNEAGPGFFKISNDPRITRVGRFIRRAYIDELPQLINVVRGEMSFVGPRPLAVVEDQRLAGFDRHRLRMTPGMTGPWQLSGPMHAPLEEMVKLDYLYASNWSIWADLDILLGTAARVLSRSGH